MIRSRARWPLACLVAAALAAVAHAENWPQWRGPANDGICQETGLPTEWSDTKNVAWKLPLPGMGGSTPAIWGDRIFLTSEDGPEVVLLCASTQGKELWRKSLGKHNNRQYMRGEGNNASASPSTDGKHVWVFDGTGNLGCFDFDGKEVWKIDVQAKYGRFQIGHGMHNTPLLDGDRLYMNLLHTGAWLVLALDKMTGKEIWKHERNSDAYAENEHSYCSPLIWRKGSEEYLVVHGNDYCTAHSLVDGKEIWRLGDLNPPPNGSYNTTLRFVATPAVTPELIVVPTAKGGVVVGVKPEARGKITAGGAGEMWRLPRNTPDVPCPLIHDGLVYLCRESGGTVMCLDAKTGKLLDEGKYHSDRYRASPVYADGKVFILSRGGVATVLKAGPKLVKLAENRMQEETTASLAISKGRIYIRGFKNLYAISEGGK